MHAPPLGTGLKQADCVMENVPGLDVITCTPTPLNMRDPSPTFETVSDCTPLCPLNPRPAVEKNAAGPQN